MVGPVVIVLKLLVTDVGGRVALVPPVVIEPVVRILELLVADVRSPVTTTDVG